MLFLISDFYDKYKYMLIGLLVFLVVSAFFFGYNKSLNCKLVFPTADGKSFYYENRIICKQKSIDGNIRRIVEELFIGPALYGQKNVFSEHSSYISSFIVDDELMLNISKSVVNELVYNPQGVSNPEWLIIMSIVNTVTINYPAIKRVQFYFDGVLYDYIGTMGPIDKGIALDRKINLDKNRK